jgi:hypothetical protein
MAKSFGRSLKCIDVFLVIYVGSNVEKLPDGRAVKCDLACLFIDLKKKTSAPDCSLSSEV